MIRNGLPALADKQWGGRLTLEQYNSVFPALHAAIPSQNLDRSIPSATSTILSYDFAKISRGVAPGPIRQRLRRDARGQRRLR